MASADAHELTRSQPETPRFGMRLWLTGAFAAVSFITAATVYIFGDNGQALLVAVLGRWGDLPAILGMTAGVLLTSLAVVIPVTA